MFLVSELRGVHCPCFEKFLPGLMATLQVQGFWRGLLHCLYLCQNSSRFLNGTIQVQSVLNPATSGASKVDLSILAETYREAHKRDIDWISLALEAGD